MRRKDCPQEIKITAKQLEARFCKGWAQHRKEFRASGQYEAFDNGDGYLVKHLTVKPSAKLSPQKRQHRAKHWVVILETARVINRAALCLLAENESTFTPMGLFHFLENLGAIPFEIIEIQSGGYL